MDQPAPNWNPCVTCGACCASFRVSFYWREAEAIDSDHPVPTALFEELTDTFRCMKGTNSKHRPQCAALQGRIGKMVSCSIYANRPSTCRDFRASFEDGKHHPKCDEARRRHGLKPLTREDWMRQSSDLTLPAGSAEAPQDKIRP